MNTELAVTEGHAKVAVKVTDLGNGTWRYDYAVMNFDFARAVTQAPGAGGGPDPRVISNKGFDSFTIPAGGTIGATTFSNGTLDSTGLWTESIGERRGHLDRTRRRHARLGHAVFVLDHVDVGTGRRQRDAACRADAARRRRMTSRRSCRRIDRAERSGVRERFRSGSVTATIGPRSDADIASLRGRKRHSSTGIR